MAQNKEGKQLSNQGAEGDGGFQMKYSKGLIFMLISATGMGLVPLFSRWATRTNMFDGAEGLNAGDSIGALMACGRMGMGVLFFVALLFITHKVGVFKKLKLTPAIALGGLMIGMSLACYVTSTLLTTVANAVMFIYTGPVICILCARIFRKEPMSVLQWICLVIVVVGMLFGEGIIGFYDTGFKVDFNLETSTAEFPLKGIGDIFGLLSGLFYGLSMFFNGYRKDADTTARGVWNFIFAVLGAGTITIILNALGANPGMENWALNIHFTAFNWIGAVLLWIICGPIALGTLLVAGRNLPAMDYGTIAYWEVPVAIFIGIVVFAEPMTINSWLGVLLIVGGGAFPTVKAMISSKNKDKGELSSDDKKLEASVEEMGEDQVATQDLPSGLFVAPSFFLPSLVWLRARADQEGVADDSEM